MVNKKYLTFPQAFGGEIVRKALHLLIAFVPLLAGVDVGATMMLLAGGTLFYVFAERLRIEGRPVLLISDLTIIASRERDRGRFVLGPVTLGVGAMLSLLLYPSTAAAIAIYALAFGDGFASLAGKLLRSPSIPFTRNKTLAGTLACLIAVFLSTWKLTGRLSVAISIAISATVLELIPIRDFDNLILPVGTGFVAAYILQL
ncbi:MAG: phosphatidate cytidylyltransferase [Spirochaetales bacterium]|nr:phosphatidate cytidylyltransferase [Spirochaetales bacterium]